MPAPHTDGRVEPAPNPPATDQTPPRSGSVIDWTDAAVEHLKRRWAEGVTARQIAIELGGPEGRHAVIGKAHRLGLERRLDAKPRGGAAATILARNATEKTAARRPVCFGETTPPHPGRLRKKSVAPPEVRAANGVDEADDGGEGVAIHELEHRHCRWIVAGEREHALYCGRRRPNPKRPYCEAHEARAFLPTPGRVRRVVRDGVLVKVAG